MKAPRTPEAALDWLRVALRDGRYMPTPHFSKRLVERRLSMPDVHYAIAKATAVTSYPRQPDHGGTCWRVTGPNLDDGEDEVSVGAEAFYDTGQQRAVLCTIF